MDENIINVRYLKILRVIRIGKCKFSSRELFKKVFSFPFSTRISALELKTKELEHLVDDLENFFKIQISKEERRRKETIQDLITEILVQVSTR